MSKARARTKRLFKSFAAIVAPPPVLKVSEWADEHRRLSSESSAEPGQWRTDRTPYMREIMDAINDEETETVVVQSSAQVGKTELLLNIIGYHVHQDPAPTMLVQPTLDLGEAFSKDRLAPMIRDTPVLAERIKNKSRDGGNTLLYKSFPGGHVTLSGANSPSSLASRPIRIVLADEIDRYPVSAGEEGDPVELVTKRTTTFFNRKRVLVSTPTIKGASRIEEFYLDSSMEQWCLPCPSCEELQPLMWGQVKFEYDKETKKCTSVAMACKHCGTLHSEREWKAGEGLWIARSDNRKMRGFHLNELASPWKRWTEVVEDFQTANRGGPEKLKVWINTALGETWEEKGTGVEADDLIKRREQYQCEIPGGVLLLTAGVDVQDNRLEYEIVGWGAEAESWGIYYGVIMGDPGQKQVWDDLDTLVINNVFRQADGQELKVATTCIDSGGHFTKQVYDYCKAREAKRVWAIKGQGGSGVPFIRRPKSRNDEGAWLFMVGVDVGKDTLSSRLSIQFEGPGYCHWPISAASGYNEEYFHGLTSEHRVMRYVKGRPSFHWELRPGHSRNEPLDCRNYATTALEIVGGEAVLEALNRQREQSLGQSVKPAAPQPPRRRAGVMSKGIEA
jgi:phage terminase large subunit GpA-like protein